MFGEEWKKTEGLAFQRDPGSSGGPGVKGTVDCSQAHRAIRKHGFFQES